MISDYSQCEMDLELEKSRVKLLERLINNPDEFEKICVEVEATFKNNSSDCAWILNSHNIEEIIVKVFTIFLQRTRLPQSSSSENEDDTFHQMARTVTFVTTAAASILAHFQQGQSSLNTNCNKDETQHLLEKVVLALVPHCVVLIATHSSEKPWTNEQSRRSCEDLKDALCKVCNCDTVEELLTRGPAWSHELSHNGRVFRGTLVLLKERFKRDVWHKEPGTRDAFSWCLLQVKHPYLGEHLDMVLPSSLLFTDDYKVNNKVLGIQCLQHIISNVDPTDLRLYGQGLVIYDALHHQLYTQKPALIGHLLQCLISILAVVERSPHKADKPRKPNRYDDVLHVILNNMEFEQRLALRQAYSQHLYLFINSMGITILRHMKVILRVILKYLEPSVGQDNTSRLFTLRALNSLILQTWPRIPNHWEPIIKVLLTILCDCCNDSNEMDEQARQATTDACIHCLTLLKRCCLEKTESALNKILSIGGEVNDVMEACVERVLAS